MHRHERMTEAGKRFGLLEWPDVGLPGREAASRLATQSLPFSLTLHFPEIGLSLILVQRNRDDHIVQNVTIPAGNWGLIMATSSDPRVIGLTFAASQ